MELPYVHDLSSAKAELQQLVELQEIGQEAIRQHRLSLLKDGQSWRGERESALTRSLLLMSYSVFEFALQQAADHRLKAEEFQKRDSRPAAERYAQSILDALGKSEDINSEKWRTALLFGRVRGLLAHTTGYQDRPFDMSEYDLLFRLGINHAMQVVPPEFHAFIFDAKSVEKVAGLLIGLLNEIETQITEEISC